MNRVTACRVSRATINWTQINNRMFQLMEELHTDGELTEESVEVAAETESNPEAFYIALKKALDHVEAAEPASFI